MGRAEQQNRQPSALMRAGIRRPAKGAAIRKGTLHKLRLDKMVQNVPVRESRIPQRTERYDLVTETGSCKSVKPGPQQSQRILPLPCWRGSCGDEKQPTPQLHKGRGQRRQIESGNERLKPCTGHACPEIMGAGQRS